MEPPRHFRIILAFALLAFVLRIPAFVYPVFSEEEASEAAVSSAVARGAELYRDVPAPEPPLGYLWTAAQYGVFGDLRQRAVHGTALLAVLASILILGMAARALGGDRGRTLAALFFAVFSVAVPPTALGAVSELYALLLASASVWLVLGGAPPRRYGLLFAAGALAAVGAMFRHEALAALAAGLSYLLVWRPLALGRPRLRPGLIGAVAMVLGFAVAYALPLAYLQNRDALGAFTSAAWSDAGVGARVAAVHVGLFFAGTALLWFLAVGELRRTWRGWRIEKLPQGSARAPGGAGAGRGRAGGRPVDEVAELDLLAGRALRGEDDAAVGFAATWLLGAVGLLCLRGRFAGGDFLALLPPLVLLSARGAASLADDFWTGPLARVFRLGLAIPVAACFGAGLFHDPLYRALGAPVVRARPIALAVRAASAPGDTLLVLGPARRVYVYAPRAPERSFEVLARQGEGDASPLPAGLRASPPAVVVDAGGPRSAALARWLESSYAPAGSVEGARILRRRAP